MRSRGNTILDFENVSKDYVGPGETVHAVADVSLSLTAGEFVTLLGPSGSGKTTMLLLAAGILNPDSGRIRFRGQDIAELNEKSVSRYRRTELGFIFQNFNLMPGTAVENVALPLRLDGVHPRTALKQAAEMLARVGLEKRVDHLATQLSGGERQRVAIARALAHSPSLVLADEPTGSLDSERGNQVLTMLHDLCDERDIAVLVVTHDERANRFADRTFRLHDGRLTAESDTPDETPAPISTHG